MSETISSPNENDPPKKKRLQKSISESPRESADAPSAASSGKSLSLGEALFALTEKSKDEQKEAFADTAETDTNEAEITDAEGTEALAKIADARELEVGAAELHGAEREAAETGEAEADIKLLQLVKEIAAKSGMAVPDVLSAAERQAREELGMHGEDQTVEDKARTDDEPAAAPREVIIDTHEPNEAWIPLDEAPESEDSPRRDSPVANPGPFTFDARHGQHTYDTHEDYVYHESHTPGALLLGGIVGNLVGKRQGRIKTEKKLLPIQRKLEREVLSIHEQLLESEMRIRRLAAEKLHTQTYSERQVRQRGVAVPERLRPSRTETRLGMTKPESVRAERLGKVLLEAQSVAPEHDVIMDIKHIRPEYVRTMNRRELLKVSEKIVIEGATLRQIYESHLIGERGLRRLITEHLQGKDIRKRLRREMVEREIDFERDPILRDKAYKEASAKSASQSLQQLLNKAGVTAAAEQDPLPGKAQQQRYEAAMQKAERHRRAADTAMITVIVVLATLVTMLLLSR